MPLPAISQRLLVNQFAAADAKQPLFALIQDGINGAKVPDALVGIAAVNCEKLGLLDTSHHVRWSEGVTAGEVTIETASEVNYTGAWSPQVVLNFSASSQVAAGLSAPFEDTARIQGAFGAYRHRITSPVHGGTVTTKMVGTT